MVGFGADEQCQEMGLVIKCAWHRYSFSGTVILSVAVQDLPMFKPFDDVTNKNRADSE